MASTKIQNLPLKAPMGAMKIPTGGFGDYSITVSSIGDFIIDAFNLATKDYVDTTVAEKEDRILTTGRNLSPVSQLTDVPDTNNDAIDEVAQALLDRNSYYSNHSNLTNRSDSNSHPSESISYGSENVKTALDSRIVKITQSDSTATTIEELVADLNLLLSKLR